MAKKKSWLGWVVKKLFTCNDKAKRAKEWKWNLRRFEVRQYPALVASRRTLCEAAEEQKKHALNVAIATAAAAEAAVAAAEAAAEFVRLTGTPGSSCKNFRKLDPNSAAIKIQSAYRAHLARKALRALKGVVRLQAIVRGRAVRRQTTPTLKRLRSNSRRQSEVWERVIHARDEWSKGGEKKTLFRPRKEVQDTEQKLEVGSQGEWDCSVLSKEDIESVWLKRQEATIKRERMKKYSFSHRERMIDTFTPQDLSSKKEHGSRSCGLVESSGEGRETSKPSTRSNVSNNTTHGNTQAKQKSTRHTTKESLKGMSAEFPLLRNSFSHEKWDPFGDAVLIPSSPAFFPTYMAATESAKAKTRSMSIPKQRVGFWDGCLERNYRHKNRLSLWSSYDGESLWRN